jgi:hypothetical protein
MPENKLQNRGMFLARDLRPFNQPLFTTNPPAIHHKNTTQKTHVFQNPSKNTSKKHKKAPATAGTFFPYKIKKN